MIPVLRPRVTSAAAVASTGVQMTHIITLLSNISTLTSTPGLLPALLTRGVVWTRGSVSITRPSLITSRDHTVLQLGTQISLLVIITNANILNKQRLKSKVRSWRKTLIIKSQVYRGIQLNVPCSFRRIRLVLRFLIATDQKSLFQLSTVYVSVIFMSHKYSQWRY